MTLLTLTENDSSEYGPRTRWNAMQSSLTIACAADFKTHGERLTERSALGRYCAIPLRLDSRSAALRICTAIQEYQAQRLNIAGNGLYTLSAHGWTQRSINLWLYHVLFEVHRAAPVSFIRSGGQTGVDSAALICAMALQIPAEGHYPKGFKLRNKDGVDRCHSEERIRQLLHVQLERLQEDIFSEPQPLCTTRVPTSGT